MRIKAALLNICLLLIFLCNSPFSVADADRALKRIITKSGNDIGGYAESHALIIGESRYTAGWPNLESIPHELETVEKVLKERGFDVHVKLNLNSRELQSAYRDFIDAYGYNPNNRLLFYYSGHGHTMNKGEKGYLVPSDAPDPDKDPRGFKRKSLDMNQIVSWSRQLEAKHALFLFDSCFSGTIFKQKARPKLPKGISRLTSKPVRQFITAGGAGETVPAQSTFTPAFVDALTYGQADLNHDGFTSGTELGLYLQDVVPQHVAQTPQYGKISDYKLSQGDFIFFPVKAENNKGVSPKQTALATSETEVLFWKGVADINTLEMYQRYLRRYPSGLFASIAWSKVNASRKEEVSLYGFNVETQPNNAKVRILNIGPKYSPGMQLPTGRYHVEVSAAGYEVHKSWVMLSKQNTISSVTLNPVKKPSLGLGAYTPLHPDYNKKVERQSEQAMAQPYSKTPEADSRYTYNDDGTVIDPKAGLQWMRCLLGQQWNGGTCQGKAFKLNWLNAKKSVATLNKTGGFASMQDWQIPSKGELSSLIYCSSNEPKPWNNTGGECVGDFKKPAISQKAFPNAESATVWWGSRMAFFSSLLLGEVDFSKGYSHTQANVEKKAGVRLVRNVDY